jgi:hypothetical protein
MSFRATGLFSNAGIIMAKPFRITPMELATFAFSRGFPSRGVDITVSITAPNIRSSLPFIGIKLVSPAYLLFMLPDADKRFVYGEGGRFYFSAYYRFFDAVRLHAFTRLHLRTSSKSQNLITAFGSMAMKCRQLLKGSLRLSSISKGTQHGWVLIGRIWKGKVNCSPFSLRGEKKLKLLAKAFGLTLLPV